MHPVLASRDGLGCRGDAEADELCGHATVFSVFDASTDKEKLALRPIFGCPISTPASRAVEWV
jgi:hypothetical protein